MYPAFLHSHVSSWALALILFVLAFMLQNGGKAKGAKITHMVLRLFYILIIVTGVGLLFLLKFPLLYLLKGVLAIWLIYIMEMILVRKEKGVLDGKAKNILWLQFVITLALVLYLGYYSDQILKLFQG